MERDLIVGGQAVMEGVMMRTPSAYAIACRKSDGEIVTTAERLPEMNDKYKMRSAGPCFAAGDAYSVIGTRDKGLELLGTDL